MVLAPRCRRRRHLGEVEDLFELLVVFLPGGEAVGPEGGGVGVVRGEEAKNEEAEEEGDADEK